MTGRIGGHSPGPPSPAIVLADEPTSEVHTQTSAEIIELLRE